jgi:hypothetical protein
MNIDPGPKPYAELETNIRISPFHLPVKITQNIPQGEAKNAERGGKGRLPDQKSFTKIEDRITFPRRFFTLTL